VRRELVPLLADLISHAAPDEDARGARERLARQTLRASRLWADDVDLLDSLAQRELDALVVRREVDASKYLLVLDGEKFGLLHPALQRRVLRLGALEVGGARDVSSRKVEEARAWIIAHERRRVWQWTRELSVEWCGKGSGNRVRLLRVEVGDV
jgi:hypothetical protein